MKRTITSILALTLVAGAAIRSDASNALNAYLNIAADDTRIEIAGSAWGRVDSMRNGEHVSGAPPRGTSACSFAADGKAFPMLDGKTSDLLGKGGAWFTLTIEDTAGDDHTYRFTGISEFSCSNRTQICSFGYEEIEWTLR